MGLYLVPAHQDNIDVSISSGVQSAFLQRYLHDQDFQKLVEGDWRLSRDLAVNYLAFGVKKGR